MLSTEADKTIEVFPITKATGQENVWSWTSATYYFDNAGSATYDDSKKKLTYNTALATVDRTLDVGYYVLIVNYPPNNYQEVTVLFTW